MSTAICMSCGHTHTWSWTEAFEKFGFDDGDGLVLTGEVVTILRGAGYHVTSDKWGLHNVVITSIKRKGRELIPASATVGYDDPRTYLPKRIVRLLDGAFTDNTEVSA